jgi:hypothetical protein
MPAASRVLLEAGIVQIGGPPGAISVDDHRICIATIAGPLCFDTLYPAPAPTSGPNLRSRWLPTPRTKDVSNSIRISAPAWRGFMPLAMSCSDSFRSATRWAKGRGRDHYPQRSRGRCSVMALRL